MAHPIPKPFSWIFLQPHAGHKFVIDTIRTTYLTQEVIQRRKVVPMAILRYSRNEKEADTPLTHPTETVPRDIRRDVACSLSAYGVPIPAFQLISLRDQRQSLLDV
jgi:hypothetical protein